MKGTPLFLPGDRVGSWVGALAGSSTVFGPQVGSSGRPEFALVRDPSAVDLSLDARRASIRELWMPQTEILFRYRLDSQGATLEAVPRPEGSRVAFGIRPCEAAAIRRVTHVFRQGKHPDPLGLEAEGMAIVGLYCASPRRTCFCAQVGSPVDMAEEACDVLMTPISGGHVLHVMTDRGGSLAGVSGAAQATSDQVSAAEAVHAGLITAVPADGAIGALEATALEVWASEVFADQGARCIGCGVCTFLCPACHCFDILDERQGTGGARYRCWDSCQFDHFTLHASRHNPRHDQAARLRQRVLHKFLYMPQEFGVTGCTGCGRCAELCPVGISIRQVVADVRAAMAQEQGVTVA